MVAPREKPDTCWPTIKTNAAMALKLLVLHGPNLNMLGLREPETYGSETLSDVDAALIAYGKQHGADITCRQSNHEGQLVDWIQEARETFDGIVLNAGAYTHTSIALHDAIRASEVPTIEVHLSNVHAREAFRHTSHISAVCVGVIAGFGALSYRLAISALCETLEATA